MGLNMDPCGTPQDSGAGGSLRPKQEVFFLVVETQNQPHDSERLTASFQVFTKSHENHVLSQIKKLYLANTNIKNN